MNTGPIQPPQGSNPHSPMNSEREQPSQYNKVRPLPYHANRPSRRSGAFQPPPYRLQPQQDGLRSWFKKQTPRFLLGCECILGALFICSFCLLGACGSIAPAAGGAAPSIGDLPFSSFIPFLEVGVIFINTSIERSISWRITVCLMVSNCHATLFMRQRGEPC